MICREQLVHASELCVGDVVLVDDDSGWRTVQSVNHDTSRTVISVRDGQHEIGSSAILTAYRTGLVEEANVIC